MPHMCQRLVRCHWSCDQQWVKISGLTELLGPCGSISHFVNNRHSDLKLGGWLVLEVLAKLMVGENLSWELPKVRVRLILQVHVILERRYAPVDWVIIGSGNGLLHLSSTTADSLLTEPPEEKLLWNIFLRTMQGCQPMETYFSNNLL